MIELKPSEYLPLRTSQLERSVPAEAGVFMLASRHSSGRFKTFYTGQSNNLLASLRRLLGPERFDLPPIITRHRGIDDCYFSFVRIPKAEFRTQVGKILTQTMDPFARMKIRELN